MSAMEQMLANMLQKVLPAEVMELLTPEKVQEVTEGINAYIVYQREFMDRADVVLTELAIVPEKNKASFEKLFAIMADMQQQIEELKHERESGSNSSNGRSRRARDGNSGITGNANRTTTGDA